jgi:hypothetical protein
MDEGPRKTCSAVRATAAALFCLSVAVAAAARSQEPGFDPRLAPVLPEVASPEPVTDYVITSTRMVEGALLGCAGESCTIAGTAIPIAQTFFIGLGVAAPAPPQLTDYMQDQVVLQDGSVAPGRMVGISDNGVVTERGSFARRDVAWIYLVPRPEQTAQPDGFGAPEEQPPEEGPDEPIGQPPPEEDSASDSTPTPGDAPQQAHGELGALWSGTIEYEWSFSDDGVTIGWAATIDDLKLREHIYPILAWDGQESRRIGTSIHLVVEDSTQSDTFLMVVEACSQTGSSVGTLDGEEDSSGSVIWKKFGDLDTTASIGWNIPAGPGMYVLSIAPGTGPTRDTYPTSGCEPVEQGYAGIVIANYPPPMQFINEFDPVVRTLDSGGGRMSGSYSATMSDGQLRVSWNVCREGVSCAGPPDDAPEEETAEEDICPEPRNETALLNLTLDQQSLLMQRLDAKFEEYFRLADEARQYEDEFNHATNHCRLWTFAKAYASFVLSNFAPASVTRYAPSPVPPSSGTAAPTQYVVEAGKEFANFLALIEKVLDNDGSWTLPNMEFEGWFSAEDIWDGFTTAYGGVAPSSFEEQIEGLRSCGAPTMHDQMDGAIRFLRLMAEVEPLMRETHEILNRLRDMDEDQLLDAWNDYRQACLDHAACAGIDAARCDSLPPR